MRRGQSGGWLCADGEAARPIEAGIDDFCCDAAKARGPLRPLALLGVLAEWVLAIPSTARWAAPNSAENSMPLNSESDSSARPAALFISHNEKDCIRSAQRGRPVARKEQREHFGYNSLN
jgi:hypothetical protein